MGGKSEQLRVQLQQVAAVGRGIGFAFHEAGIGARRIR